MQLVPLLLVISMVLSLFSAIMVTLGSREEDRWRAVCFCIAMCGMLIWTLGTFMERFGLLGIEKISGLVQGMVWIGWIIGTVALLVMIDWRRIAKKTRIAQGWRLFLVGVALSFLAGTIFCLIMPKFGNEAKWGGPLISATSVIFYYYAILRYKILDLSVKSLKIWSRFLVAIVAVMAYIVLFFFISKYLFHIDSSTEILALNVVMIILVVLIWPVMNDINIGINSLISTKDINYPFIVKKLNRMATQNVKMRELADFLADYLHFQDVGFIVQSKFYATNSLKLKKDQIAQIALLKNSEKTIWQEVDPATKVILDGINLKAVAELRNAKGRPFGQILVGRPTGKMELEKRDLIELETIINLVASLIDSAERIKS